MRMEAELVNVIIQENIMKDIDFIAKRYRKEKRVDSKSTLKKKIVQAWFQEDTIDSWRHERLYKLTDPFLHFYQGNVWLTIGDGRCGTDAHYILKNGGQVIASNIEEGTLKSALQMKYIKKYRVENAEDLSMKDNSYDFTFCKEALHHLPRPYIGIYEMFRVSKKGIVLIEPNDIFHNHSVTQEIFWKLKRTIKQIFGLNESIPYETVGNYIFRVSHEEIEKIAIALDYKYFISKGINDIYEPGLEYIKRTNVFKFFQVKARIFLLDTLCLLGFLKHNDIFMAILKIKIPNEMKRLLKEKGYQVIALPKNPYV